MPGASQSGAADAIPRAAKAVRAAAMSALFSSAVSGLVSSVTTKSIAATIADPPPASKPAGAAGAPPLIVIAGPTASGKSALALAIGREFGGTIINADSLQVYRELRILTARPDAAAEAVLPHRLYGLLPATERCSAGRWATLAEAEIGAAAAAGRLPIL